MVKQRIVSPDFWKPSSKWSSQELRLKERLKEIEAKGKERSCVRPRASSI
jgi:hypothetical protein